MEFKDYYATLGVASTASQAEVKRAYRKLARKYHPDVSKEVDAEARFKDVAEAHEALIDPERRAAYDEIAQRHRSGQPFDLPPGWDGGYEYSGRGNGAHRSADPDADFSDFFSSLFGNGGRGGGQAGGRAGGRSGRGDGASPFEGRSATGQDHHARVRIDLEDAYHGGHRTISLRMPTIDANGQPVMNERHLDVNIPRGVSEGQLLRLAGQGSPGHGGAPAGDLYLEIVFSPHRRFRVDGRDVAFDLPVSPWEAALGAKLTVATPDGEVELGVPAGSANGRRLRLKGKGLPGQPAGDLYAVIGIMQPAAGTDPERQAYAALAKAFPHFDPRHPPEA
jgi:curved DNA-binding protein